MNSYARSASFVPRWDLPETSLAGIRRSASETLYSKKNNRVGRTANPANVAARLLMNFMISLASGRCFARQEECAAPSHSVLKPV
jgi:hypothetical protein